MTTFSNATDVRHGLTAWDETHDSRETFLAYLQAQCAPGQPKGPIPRPGQSAEAAVDSAAAILLALLDQGTSLAIEDRCRETFQWLYDATGAPAAPVDEADFILTTHQLADVLSQAKRGTASQPEQGATVVCAGGDLTADQSHTPVTLTGPGIADSLDVALPMSTSAIQARAQAIDAYPMGVDVVITLGDQLIALPRSCRIRLEGS